jgi:hypothetical protein
MDEHDCQDGGTSHVATFSHKHDDCQVLSILILTNYCVQPSPVFQTYYFDWSLSNCVREMTFGGYSTCQLNTRGAFENPQLNFSTEHTECLWEPSTELVNWTHGVLLRTPQVTDMVLRGASENPQVRDMVLRNRITFIWNLQLILNKSYCT